MIYDLMGKWYITMGKTQNKHFKTCKVCEVPFRTNTKHTKICDDCRLPSGRTIDNLHTKKQLVESLNKMLGTQNVWKHLTKKDIVIILQKIKR
jgi:hypothetical protein